MRWALPLLLPALVVGPATQQLADAMASRAARVLAAVGSALPRPPRAEPSEPAPSEPDAELDPSPSLPITAVAEPANRKAKAVRATNATDAPRVYVSARQVLALAEGSALPRGVPVAQGKHHPAGLRLSGVARLGVGLQEGDILTHVEGRPVTARGQVIEAVLAARARKATVISGVFYRNGRRGLLIVEQPYVADPPGRP